MIEQIKHNGEILAIIIPSSHSEAGVHFLTPATYPQQMAQMRHPKGHRIQAHKHIPYHREIKDTQEVLFIRRGRLKINFIDDDKSIIGSRTIGAGDVVLLVQGGHGFEVIEDVDMIEVKQGPYIGEKDKVKF